MGLATSTKSFDCTIDDGLAHVILNQPERGNPIDGDFCREFGLGIAELSAQEKAPFNKDTAEIARRRRKAGDAGVLPELAAQFGLANARCREQKNRY